MNARKLGKVFKIVKKEAKLVYAVVKPDKLGDCNSCVNYALLEKYGESNGIWVKHWTTGMNKGDAIKYLDKLYIAHDITEEQFYIIKKALEDNGYDVWPNEYISNKSIIISEKGE